MLREQSEQSTYDSKNIGIHLVQTKIDKDWNVDPLAWEMPLPRLATAWPEVAQVSIPARSFGKDGLDLLLKSQHLQPLSLLHLLNLSPQFLSTIPSLYPGQGQFQSHLIYSFQQQQQQNQTSIINPSPIHKLFKISSDQSRQALRGEKENSV